jgi:diguanylate cyclase (GGDEF)-like protein
MVRQRQCKRLPPAIRTLCSGLLVLLLLGATSVQGQSLAGDSLPDTKRLPALSGNQRDQVLALEMLARQKLSEGLYPEALALSGEAINQAGDTAPPELAGQVRYTRGLIELKLGNVALAMEHLQASAAYWEKTGDVASLALAYSAIAECHRHFAEYEASMAWHQLAHATAMLADDSDVQSAIFNRLGDLYDALDQPGKALEYYQKSLDLEVGESLSRVEKTLSLGRQYHAIGLHADALASYEIALSLLRQLELGQHEAEILMAMARTYLAMNETQQALQWAQAALYAAGVSGVEVQVIAALNTLSTVFLSQQNFLAAVAASEKALVMAQSQEVPRLIIDTLRQLAQAYKAGGRFQESTLTLELFNRANEKQLVDKAGRRLAHVQGGLEAEVARQEIMRLQQDKQIQDLKLEKQHRQRVFWIVQTVFLVMVIAALLWRYVSVRKTARTDELTRIPNRLYMSRHLVHEFRCFQRYGSSCCAMILDIDDFKQFNDRHGHDCGDRVLMLVAKLLESSTRETDLVARWGGEEFMVLFPHTNLAPAVQVAERMRAAIEQHDFTADSAAGVSGVNLRVSITAGVAEVASVDASVADWLKRADEALYRGKRSGKNRVQASEPLKRALALAQ